MKVNKLEMLSAYLKSNVGPILLEKIPENTFDNRAELLPSTCEITELNGHYERTDFVPPKWYFSVQNKEKNAINLLVITGLDQISLEEQMKFYELLKYRKIGVFSLPKNCQIIVLVDAVTKNTIHPEIYALLVHI